MNSLLRIRIRVAVEQAQQLVQLMNSVGKIGASAKGSQAGVAGLNTALKNSAQNLKQINQATTGFAGFGGLIGQAAAFGRSIGGLGPSMIDIGKSVQWTGRQLEYNFTLPLVRAGRAVGGMMLENEKALTRLVKVYGDALDETTRLESKFITLGTTLQSVDRGALTPAQETAYDLGRAFRALSDIFGLSIDQVSDLGAQWAAAGATGRDLAVATRTTMEAMVLGDFNDTEEAFKALIAIQQGYQLSMEQTRSAMAALNQVENMTAASFTDLTLSLIHI